MSAASELLLNVGLNWSDLDAQINLLKSKVSKMGVQGAGAKTWAPSKPIVGYTQNINQATTALSKLEQATGAVKRESNVLTRQKASEAKIIRQTNDAIKKNSLNYKRMGNETNRLRGNISALSAQQAKGTALTHRQNQVLQASKRRFNELKKAQGSVFAGMGKTIRRTVIWASMWTIMYSAIRLVTSGLKGMITVSIKLEAAMARIQSVTTSASKNMQLSMRSLKSAVISYATTHATSFEATSQALFKLSTAHLNSREAALALAPVMDLVIATTEDLTNQTALAGKTAEVVAGIYNNYGMQMDQTMDTAQKFRYISAILADTFADQQIEMSELADGLKHTIGLYSKAGVPVELLIASVGTLNTQFIKGATAGTGLRRVLIAMFKESDKLARQLGVTIEPDRLLQFQKVMEKISESIKASGNEAYVMEKLIRQFGIRGTPAVVSLAAAFDQTLKLMKQYPGAMDRLAQRVEMRMNTMQGATIIFGNVLRRFGLELFEVIGGTEGWKEVIKGLTTGFEHLTSILMFLNTIVKDIFTRLANIAIQFNNLVLVDIKEFFSVLNDKTSTFKEKWQKFLDIFEYDDEDMRRFKNQTNAFQSELDDIWEEWYQKQQSLWTDKPLLETDEMEKMLKKAKKGFLTAGDIIGKSFIDVFTKFEKLSTKIADTQGKTEALQKVYKALGMEFDVATKKQGIFIKSLGSLAEMEATQIRQIDLIKTKQAEWTKELKSESGLTKRAIQLQSLLDGSTFALIEQQSILEIVQTSMHGYIVEALKLNEAIQIEALIKFNKTLEEQSTKIMQNHTVLQITGHGLLEYKKSLELTESAIKKYQEREADLVSTLQETKKALNEKKRALMAMTDTALPSYKNMAEVVELLNKKFNDEEAEIKKVGRAIAVLLTQLEKFSQIDFARQVEDVLNIAEIRRMTQAGYTEEVTILTEMNNLYEKGLINHQDKLQFLKLALEYEEAQLANYYEMARVIRNELVDGIYEVIKASSTWHELWMSITDTFAKMALEKVTKEILFKPILDTSASMMLTASNTNLNAAKLMLEASIIALGGTGGGSMLAMERARAYGGGTGKGAAEKSIIQKAFGGVAMGTTAYGAYQQKNPFTGLLGGAMAGFGAFGPWGALAGGLLGGIAGWIGKNQGTRGKSTPPVVTTETVKVTNRIDVTNKELQIVNRNLVAMRRGFEGWVRQTSYYLRQRPGIGVQWQAREFAVNQNRGYN